MSDKTRKLEDLKREGKDQERRAEQMKTEAERHKKEVDTLEQASATLKKGLAELETPESVAAIRDLDRAKDSAKSDIDRLKSERERLMAENARMSETIKNAQQRSRTVGQQLALIHGAAQGETATMIGEVKKLLGSEWNHLVSTDAMLSTARLKLQQLKID